MSAAPAVRLLYLDEVLAIVDKPSGIVVHPGWAHDGGGLVRQVREALHGPAHPVHRLDRGASGALAFARTQEAAAALGSAFAGGTVGKRYLAIVRGHPPDRCVIDHPIPGKEGGERVPAITELLRLATFERYALVEARPLTGRLHQIRRHCKHLACPIIGDANYGKSEHNRIFRERFGLARLALHAFELQLPHPVSGATVTVGCPPSGELAACLVATGMAVPHVPTGVQTRS